ncbi:MAG: glycosyltransferase family 4 protein [Candidatus Yanofskybacteria bacterium]|nr:glycosyltransferase family 4 protein [Candidatus Yanofskybacteria bacterium]
MKEHPSAYSRKSIKVCHVVSADITLKFILFDFLKDLQESGFEVHAVSSNGKWVQEIRGEGIQVKIIAITRKLFTPVADLLAVIQLVRFFRKERFDIVHTHTPKATFLGQIAAFLARVPVRVTTIHGLFFQRGSSWKKKLVFVPVEYIVAKIVHHAFLVNREDARLLADWKIYPPEKMTHLGGGVDIERFNPDRISGQFINQKKRELGIQSSQEVIGIVARLVEEKGFLPLFEAFARVLKHYPRAVLMAVGPHEPDKKDALDPDAVKEYGIERNVLFLGERTDTPELYALMDMLVLPSYREGLGISLIEASAMEKPVVASNIRGCREVVEHEKTGLLVPSGNPEELAKALLFILSHPREANAMGKAGRKKIEQEFNEKFLFDIAKKEYQALLKKQHLHV